MRLPIVAFVLLFAGSASAQDLKGTVVAVPDVKSKAGASAGGAALGKSLRKQLSNAGLELVPAAKLKKGFKGKSSPKDLAKAGKAAGAAYVLQVTITKTKWLYTANAVLINTATGETQMDFKSGYYKPKEEAADRGERIARVTLEKLGTLAGEGPAVAVAPTPPADARPPVPSARVDQRVDEPIERPDEKVEDPPVASNDRLAADPVPSERIADPAPPAETPPPDPEPPLAIASSPPPSETMASDPPGTVSATFEPQREQPSDLMIASVTAGSRFLHSFNLSSANTPESKLSYNLKPLASFAGELEFLIPDIGVGVMARAAFSPARFQINFAGAEGPAEPTGSLFDLGFGLKLHFAVSGEGRDATELVPTAGLRIESLNVDTHPGAVMHANRSIAPFVGLALRLPLAETLETTIGAEGGYIVSYTEQPVADGALSSGFIVGGGLGLKWWLASAVGVALDGRFDLRSIKLSGPSDRSPPPPQETLTDVSISTRDLSLTLGLAFRI